MDAYTSNYLTQGTSETLKKLYRLNLTKQQEHEYKSQQKSSTYHLMSQNFSLCSISKLTQTQFEELDNFLHDLNNSTQHLNSMSLKIK